MPVPGGQNEDGPPHWKGETAVFLGGALTVLLVTVYAPGMPHVLDMGALVGSVVGGVIVMAAYRRWRRRRAERG
ncbi:hypothetical protein ABZ114_28820 [Streptomyces albidoflavus]|uniref:hypothetical protein n=1 Tax=Streptomyces TaxID=1883 RepID=UPI00063E79C6|nr:hypothetical protein [Streptomyces sp. KE1]KLI94609.1 hypothetical protein WQ59_28615 [Streptomyces sp. KE1]